MKPFLLLFLLPLFSFLQLSAQQTNPTSEQKSKQLFDKFFALSDGDSIELSQKLKLARQIIQTDSLSKYTYHVASWAAILGKEYDGLEEGIKRIIKNHPDFAEAHFLYGVYLDQANKEGAVEEIQKCIEMSPKLPQPYFYLTTLFEEARNYKLALVYYNLLEQVEANHKSVYYNRANVKASLQDYAGAIDDYSKTIAKNPTHYRAIFNRGQNYLRVENYAAAEADFNAFLKFMPNYGEAYYYRAAAKHYLSKAAEACEDFKKAASLGSEAAIKHLQTSCK